MKRTLIVVALIAALIVPVWAQTGTTNGYDWRVSGNGIIITWYEGTATAARIPDTINNLPVVRIERFGTPSDNARLTSITIPNTVTHIGTGAFSGATRLTSVTLPSSLIEIGESAFEGCTALTSITLPAAITTIGHSAFKNCSALITVNIPDSVRSITFGSATANYRDLQSEFRGTKLNDASRQRLVNRGYTGAF